MFSPEENIAIPGPAAALLRTNALAALRREIDDDAIRLKNNILVDYILFFCLYYYQYLASEKSDLSFICIDVQFRLCVVS